MARNKNNKEKETAMPDEAAIAAALSHAVTDVRGNPVNVGVGSRGAPPPPQDPLDCKPARHEECGLDEQKDVAVGSAPDISAKEMFDIAKDVVDQTLVEHIRSINKRIRDEAVRGCFSTNIQFKVFPNNWVNVPKLVDWYRTRGFQILNYETSSSPYGKDVGTVLYSFTISWATVQ